MKKRFPAVVLALALCLALAAPAFAVEPASYGRHPSSSDDRRAFVTDGQSFYYIVDSGPDDGPSAIMKQDADGSRANLYQGSPWNQVDGGTGFENLNIVDGWLYFTREDATAWLEADVCICRIRTDGTEYSELYKVHCKSTANIHDMLIVDGTVYFLEQTTTRESPSLMSMSLDGSGVKKLYQGKIFDITVSGRQLALLIRDSTVDKSILFYDIATAKSHTVELTDLRAGSAGSFQASPSGEFYLYWGGNTKKPAQLYQISPDGGSLTEFDAAYNCCIIVGNQMLYYDYDDSSVYLRALDDAESAVKITDRAVYKEFGYHNGWLFTREPEDRRSVHMYAVPDGTSTPIPAGPVIKPSFTDVPADEWFAKPVAWAIENEITLGTTPTTFSPQKDCTHGEILTFLWGAEGKPNSSAQPSISLKGNEFYAEAVRWATGNGIIGEDFDPDKPCTRADAVSYIWRVFDRPSAKASSFVDVSADAPYARAVDWAVEEEITNGNNPAASTFGPDDICSRAHIVTFLYRAYTK